VAASQNIKQITCPVRLGKKYCLASPCHCSVPGRSLICLAESDAKRDLKVSNGYIPELSEVRMVKRAPDTPFAFADGDRIYVESCLRDIEVAFGLDAFPGLLVEQIPGRTLIGHFIYWWRRLEPSSQSQGEAHARLPAAIRLLDTLSAWMEERAGMRGHNR
jgi:hypothetical protein